MTYLKIHPVILGITLGTLWGLGLFFVGIGNIYAQWGNHFITTFGSVYVGYTPGLLGSLVGFLWGFIDGFIAGFLSAGIYNFLLHYFIKQK